MHHFKMKRGSADLFQVLLMMCAETYYKSDAGCVLLSAGVCGFFLGGCLCGCMAAVGFDGGYLF